MGLFDYPSLAVPDRPRSCTRNTHWLKALLRAVRGCQGRIIEEVQWHSMRSRIRENRCLQVRLPTCRAIHTHYLWVGEMGWLRSHVLLLKLAVASHQEIYIKIWGTSSTFQIKFRSFSYISCFRLIHAVLYVV